MLFALLGFLRELSQWTIDNCQPVEDNVLTTLLIIGRYANLFIIVAVYGATFRYAEIYLLLFAIGQTVNIIVNSLLRLIVNDQTLASPLCVDNYWLGAWPSFQSQDTTFLVVTALTYPLLFKARMGFIHQFGILLLYFAVIGGDSMLNYHTTSQIAAGVIAGAVVAIVFQMAAFFASTYFKSLLRYQPFVWLGYVDTMCQADDQPPADSPQKIN